MRDAATGTDVLLDCDDTTSVADVADHLAKAINEPSPVGLWADGVRIDATIAIGDCGLRDGSDVAFDENTVAPTEPAAWQLKIVAGLDIGTVMDLSVGRHEIGRQSGISDPAVSRRHLAVHVSPTGVALSDLSSSNGTTVDGRLVHPDSMVSAGPDQLISMGNTQAVLVPAAVADAPLTSGRDGTLTFSRPPRLTVRPVAETVVIPVRPIAPPNRRIPVATIVVPLVLGVGMAFLLGQKFYLIFALASPAMAASNIVSDRRGNAKQHRAAMADYEAEVAATQTEIEQLLDAETRQRRESHPDPAELLRIVTLPQSRLWERRLTDPDALSFRLGTADLPARLTVRSTGLDRSQIVHAVPVTIGLATAGVVGVAGPPDQADQVVFWLLAQCSALHTPRDVSLTLLTSTDRSGWSWFAWLPHTQIGPRLAGARIGNDPASIADRIAELAAVIADRRSLRRPRADNEPDPAHVVVVDGARSLRAVPGVAQLLQHGPQFGVYFLCLESDERFLPEECTTVIGCSDATPGLIAVTGNGQATLKQVVVDQVTADYCDTMARSLAPIRETAAQAASASLPEATRLLDVLELDPPTATAILERWRRQPASTRLTIGVTADGPVAVDLSRDGPHALVAGTTGSGKSELLQSMIASLAVANRPDVLNLVLVDYKGGSAFRDCVRLPHTVGLVTDLDSHLVQRALTSLGAELKRREQLLASVGAKDIEEYPALPRLVLAIDEFAAMARELPEFVTGLVNIAQRGRSLGLHLILATQRPSGVVSAEIRANTNLRIALRMTDDAESVDVINTADSARIPIAAPGRANARVGHGPLVAFQTGRINGRHRGIAAESTRSPFIVPIRWIDLGQPLQRRIDEPAAPESDATDLAVLVESVRAAAAAASIGPQRSPWLDPLPALLRLDQLPVAESGHSGLPEIPYALEDLPLVQQQRSATLDLAGGHLFVIGSPRSGRSQLLRTLAGSVAMHQSPTDVHLYGLDCGNGALLAMAALPHCGAVVSRTQQERATRLLNRFVRDLELRHEALATGGFADITEQRCSVDRLDRLPHLLLLLDNWEGFVLSLGEIDHGRLTESVLRLLREGAACGIHIIITGDRSLASGRIGSLSDSKIALRFADRADYAYVGIHPRQLPDDIPVGRGFRAESMIELQIALLADDLSGQAQAKALAELGIAAGQRHQVIGPRPFRIDELPSRLSLDDVFAMPSPAGCVAVVGVGGDEQSVLGPDVSKTPAFVVAGPGGSGRSTVLVAMARSLTWAGAEVVIAAPRSSSLQALLNAGGVRGVITDPAAPLEVWDRLLGIKGGRPLIVVIDDGELFRESAAGELLRSVMKGGTALATSIILGGSTEGLFAGLSNWQHEAKRSRQGLLLRPQSNADGELIGVRLPRSAVTTTVQPGRGLLHLGDGQLVTVAIPREG